MWSRKAPAGAAAGTYRLLLSAAHVIGPVSWSHVGILISRVNSPLRERIWSRLATFLITARRLPSGESLMAPVSASGSTEIRVSSDPLPFKTSKLVMTTCFWSTVRSAMMHRVDGNLAQLESTRLFAVKISWDGPPEIGARISRHAESVSDLVGVRYMNQRPSGLTQHEDPVASTSTSAVSLSKGWA